MWTDRSVLLVLGLLSASTACRQPALAPAGINVVSDRSDYSPTAQLAVALEPLTSRGDTIEVVVDSGSLSVLGDRIGGGGAMYNVHLAALIVTRAKAPRGKGLPSPWIAVAESDSQLVLPSIGRGERRAIEPMTFLVLRPVAVHPRDAWVVFRITGVVIPTIARMVGAQPSPSIPGARRFRVYACADWNLEGRIDRKRAQVMKASYLKAC